MLQFNYKIIEIITGVGVKVVIYAINPLKTHL